MFSDNNSQLKEERNNTQSGFSNNNHERDEYKNRANLTIETCDKKHVLHSNRVEAKKAEIRVTMQEDCNLVFEGDTITYTVKICNDSNTDFNDCVFYDDLPNGLEYEKNSFKVNGVCKTPEVRGNNITYLIKELCDHSETTITFKAKVY